MREVVIKRVKQRKINSLTCDKCGKREEPSLGVFDGWRCFTEVGGYGSLFGDMAMWELDLCDDCFYGMVKGFVRYPGKGSVK